MENPIEMDDLGVPLFSETSIFGFMTLLAMCFPVKVSSIFAFLSKEIYTPPEK